MSDTRGTQESLPTCPRCGSHKLTDAEAHGWGWEGRFACGGRGMAYAQTPACKVIADLRDDEARQTRIAIERDRAAEWRQIGKDIGVGL